MFLPLLCNALVNCFDPPRHICETLATYWAGVLVFRVFSKTARVNWVAALHKYYLTKGVRKLVHTHWTRGFQGLRHAWVRIFGLNRYTASATTAMMVVNSETSPAPAQSARIAVIDLLGLRRVVLH